MNPSELTITDLVSAIRYAQEEADSYYKEWQESVFSRNRSNLMESYEYWRQQVARFQSILRTKLQEIK
jgi:hypothetical protein